MHFGLSDEQQQLRDIARPFLAEVPSLRQRLERPDGHVYDARTWQRMVEEHGWPAMSLPEAVEGWGFGMVELAVVLEELGRTLTPCPLFATVGLAQQALRGLEGAEGLLGELAAGRTATLALWEVGAGAGQGQGEDTPAAVLSAASDGSLRLNGSARRVLDGDSASLILVETEEGLVALDRDRPGLRLEAVHGLDPSRPLATAHFDDIEVHPSRHFPDFDLGSFHARARTLLAAEQTGIAQGCLDLTVDYAKVRVQYGKPIGAFQAVQHQLADMLVAVESARSAAWYAAAALDEDLPDADAASLTALATATEAATLCAGQAIQLHGGIGFTWEHDAHVYFKRAASNRHLLGSPASLRAIVAEALLGPLGEAS